jgi:diketogulonate reductase-like aldo/keto reductase
MYGTAWKKEATTRHVLQAVAAGFTAIDTANQLIHYDEARVGDALLRLSQQGTTREQLFLQTKFTYAGGQDHRLPYDPHAGAATQVRQSFASSLEHLQVDTLDSYVLHGPSRGRGLPEVDLEVWRTMEELHSAGRERYLGVSNVALDQLETLFAGATVTPMFVQNRCFARTRWDARVRAFCRANGIIYQGFSLLTANVSELRSAKFREIVQRTGRTPAQIVFRFAMQVGMLPLTGTTDAAHMREDLEALHFELAPDDVSRIENLAVR